MLQTKNVHHLKEVTNAALFDGEPDSLQALFKRQPIEHLAAGHGRGHEVVHADP